MEVGKERERAREMYVYVCMKEWVYIRGPEMMSIVCVCERDREKL